MKKTLTALILAASLCACATLRISEPDWISTGPAFAPNTGKVEIIGDRSDIRRPYGNLGMTRIYNVPRKRENIRAALEKITKFAASKGADAILVSQQYDDERQSDTIMLIGFAIKYVDNLTPEDEAAIKEFETLGVIDEY